MDWNTNNTPHYARKDEWNESQAAFQEWLATPKDERFPSTQTDLAVILGHSDQTLSNWKQLPGFMDRVRWICKKNLADYRADVYRSLRREAVGGSYHHIKLYVELLGDHVERLDVTSGGKTLDGDARIMTTEELAKRFAEERASSPQMKALGVSPEHLEAIVNDMMSKGVAGLDDLGIESSDEEDI